MPAAASDTSQRLVPCSTVGANSALGAYKRRHYDSSGANTRALAMAEGTLSAEAEKARQRLEAERAEARYRDKHAFVGEHYNDI